jgi:hypothetical protein
MAALLTSARPARAAWFEDAGWGALTVLTNVIYMPAKIVYATAGGLTGAFALALTGGDMQTANTVWVTTMTGTYVVTPGMLQGQEPIAFTGVPSSETATADSHGLAEPAAADNHGLEEQQLGGS